MKTGGAGPEYLPLAELADEPFALPWFDRSTAADVIGLRRAVEEYFRAHNFRPQNIIFRSNSRSAVVEMVKRGQAVTICDRFARYGASDRYNAWSLQPTPPQQRGALVFRKGEEESATIAAIIQAVLHDVSEKPRTLFVDIQALRDNKKSPERAAEEVSAKRSIIRKQVSKNEPSEPVSKDKLD
jgi:DNA-binding transcriptional LysR family regulator